MSTSFILAIKTIEFNVDDVVFLVGKCTTSVHGNNAGARTSHRGVEARWARSLQAAAFEVQG